MWCFFDMKNHRKAITRLGEEDFGTNMTERLLVLNSYAKTVGFTVEPYKNVSAPSVDLLAPEEHLGFSYSLELTGSVTNPTVPNNNNIHHADADNAESETEEDGGDDEGNFANDQREFESVLREACEDLDIEIVFEESPV